MQRLLVPRLALLQRLPALALAVPAAWPLPLAAPACLLPQPHMQVLGLTAAPAQQAPAQQLPPVPQCATPLCLSLRR